MQETVRERSRLLALSAAAALIIAIFFLAGLGSVAGAQPEPQKEPFRGELVAPPPGQPLSDGQPVDVANLGPEWWAVFNEEFEAPNWENKWDVNLDLSNPPVGLSWGAQLLVNTLDPASTRSGWSICADANCSNVDPIAPTYPNGLNSWLVAGPFNLAGAEDAQLNFDLLYEANGGDAFTVAVSQDRLQFTPQFTMNQNVNQGAWEAKSVPLAQFVGDPAKPQVWIAFTFTSGGSAQKLGALIDNVKLYVKGEPPNFLPIIAYGFTPTPPPVTPTPTASPTPVFGGDYLKNFTNNIDGWSARRWTLGTAYEVAHDPASDGDRQGFLNVKVNTRNSHYVIVSPLVRAKQVPYNIETVVKLRSDRNTGDQYGIIFGGNYNGGDCPAVDFSTCFTEYYEMRVRYYVDGDRTRMEMKLKRVNSHDSNNNNDGPDLIEWERVRDVDEDDFIEWDVLYESNGKISIAADDRPVASVTDSTYINNPYFGVIVRTEDEPDAEAKFDYFKVD